ncbi:MAG: DNA adenine methylase [Hyphomicrobiaceae bacterium]|nr:MAG: DNA adenine methylase [Hyphomicrobiaceae bacterium]
MLESNIVLENVIPVSPVAPWMGGKSQLAPILCPLIDRIPHVTYAEPFMGMGGIFFRRSRKPKAEIINDFSRDVINLFRILSRHFPQFCDVLKWQVTSRAEFERLKAADPNTLTDLERAARFLYLQRTCFGGKVRGQNFGIIPDGPARFDLTKLVPLLEEVHSRLTSVVIENLDYKDFIARYDREGALFYLDPPYYECETDYGKDAFSRDEFPLMAEILKNIQGRFILSINDHPDIRGIFSGFLFKEVEVQYSVGGGEKVGRFGELIISNFDLTEFEDKDLFDV